MTPVESWRRLRIMLDLPWTPGETSPYLCNRCAVQGVGRRCWFCGRADGLELRVVDIVSGMDIIQTFAGPPPWQAVSHG